MTTTTSVLCPKCGIIKKSGKRSCCGRGGSWFGNCGSAGNTKLHHTWYGGAQACKTMTESNAFIGQKLHGVQHKKNGSVDDAGRVNSTTLASANTPKPIAGTLPMIKSVNMSANVSINMSIITTSTHTSIETSASTSMVFGKSMKINIIIYISILVIIVFEC